MSETVSINGDTYDVYVTVAEVDTYANGSTTGGDWQSLTDDDKARAIVTATRWIDAQCWQGDKVDPDQPNAFPRTVGSLATIEQACILLSVMLATTPDLYDQLSGATGGTEAETRRLKAGSVEIEYWRKLRFSVFDDGTVSIFPRNVMSLIGQWLCDNASGSLRKIAFGGSVSYGTCHKTNYRRGKYGFMEPL